LFGNLSADGTVAATVFARRTVDGFAAFVADLAPPAFLIAAPTRAKTARRADSA
jgi:hypothetical protein